MIPSSNSCLADDQRIENQFYAVFLHIEILNDLGVNCMRVSHQGRLNPLAVILIDRRPQILFR
jgi:hypothetical protein